MGERQRILITVKTYPTLSRKYGETVCTAGLREDGTWVRLYPVSFRRLDQADRYSKYDWIECRLQRNQSDPRPETFRLIDQNELRPVAHMSTEDNWRERRQFLLKTAQVYDLSFIIIDPAGMVPLVALRRTKKPGSARAGTCRDHAINGPRSWTTQSRGTPAIDAQRLNWLRRRRAIRSGGGAHPLAATRRLLRSVMVGA